MKLSRFSRGIIACLIAFFVLLGLGAYLSRAKHTDSLPLVQTVEAAPGRHVRLPTAALGAGGLCGALAAVRSVHTGDCSGSRAALPCLVGVLPSRGAGVGGRRGLGDTPPAPPRVHAPVSGRPGAGVSPPCSWALPGGPSSTPA